MDLEVIYDVTKQELTAVPDTILKMHNLRMLYMDKNKLVSLPDCIFESLPCLTWLDLRDNLLESIPNTIGVHKCLENILLQNNRITHLPKELSRLTTLKVLGLADNPLVYPPPKVVDLGIDDVMIFLQQELHIAEQELHAMATRSETFSRTSSSILTSVLSTRNRTESGTMKVQILPIDIENAISDRIQRGRQQYLDDRCTRDKVHNVTKSPSKTTITSYFQSGRIRDPLPSQDKMQVEQIKQEWLAKMKELINEQESILEHEKAMTALQNWRKDQKSSPQLKISASINKKSSEVPFDTNSAYNAYMSRDDPTEDINKALQEQKSQYTKADISKMITEIMIQMQKARDNVAQAVDPEEKIRQAQEELNLILSAQKKIAQLQEDRFL